MPDCTDELANVLAAAATLVAAWQALQQPLATVAAAAASFTAAHNAYALCIATEGPPQPM